MLSSPLYLTPPSTSYLLTAKLFFFFCRSFLSLQGRTKLMQRYVVFFNFKKLRDYVRVEKIPLLIEPLGELVLTAVQISRENKAGLSCQIRLKRTQRATTLFDIATEALFPPAKLNKNKNKNKKKEKKNTPASKSFADPFPHHSVLLLTAPTRLSHTWPASSVALNRARSVPRLGKICRAARKINQLHIHYTRKSCGRLCFIIGSLFFSRRPLHFRPPTFPSTLFRFCWRAGQLDPSKTILHLVPPGSSWSTGPSAELLRQILFKEQAGVLILCLHLFAIFCSAVLEAL